MTPSDKAKAWDKAARAVYVDAVRDGARPTDYVLFTIVPALLKRGQNIERRGDRKGRGDG
jgi:hypothetical protein